MNNYDRIYREISKATEELGPVNGLDPKLLLNLIMEVVQIEDQNRTKKVPNINKQVQAKILLIAQGKIDDKEGQ